jgi:hypothetical protein
MMNELAKYRKLQELTKNQALECPHLVAAAFLAISFRLFGDNAFALAGPPALPPLRPSSTAAAFLPSTVVFSPRSP